MTSSIKEIENRIHSNLKMPIKTEYLNETPNKHIHMRFIDHNKNPYKYIYVSIPYLNIRTMTDSNGFISFTIRGGDSRIIRGTLYNDGSPMPKYKYDFEFLAGEKCNFTFSVKLNMHFYMGKPINS